MLGKLMKWLGATPPPPPVTEEQPGSPGRVLPLPDVLAQAFGSDFTGTAADERYAMTTVHLGTVYLPSGKLVTLDPLTSASYDPDPLALTVLPGRYPVDLAIADTGTGGMRVAMARIGFSDEPAVEWRMAHTDAEDPSTLRGDAIFGFDVDSGTGAFADPTVVTAIAEALDAVSEYEGSVHERWVDEGEAHAATLGIPYGFALNAAFAPGDIAMFSTGWGDGTYASWVGYDAAGRPARVVTDFAVVEAVDIPEA